MYGGDGGGKLYFLLLKFIKRKKAYFWAKCLEVSPIVASFKASSRILDTIY